MTYQIFGEEESIFGYQGLKINLRYNACDMRPGLQITYGKKFKTIGETEPTDLKATMEEYLPKSELFLGTCKLSTADQVVAAFEKSNVFESTIADSSYENFQPPGELWQTMEAGGQTYEIWKGNLADMAVQQLVKRIQILVLFYIEGGNYIELREADTTLERWTVFFLYQKKTVDVDPKTSPYVFMGYSTVFRYFYYQPISPPPSPPAKKQRISREADLEFRLPLPELQFSDFTCRSRISQFVILPPFQGGGNGSRLYNSIFDCYLGDPRTLEITVEDPNEAFDDLRDLNDLTRLRTVPEFSALQINTEAAPRAKGPVPKDIIDSKKLEKIRTSMKIAPRQFARLVELQLLSRIPSNIRQSLLVERPTSTVPDLKTKQHEYRLWKLWTKSRLYRHNKDTLIQLDRVERIDKLDEALGSVEADYARLLRALHQRQDSKTEAASSNGKRPPPDGDAVDGEPSSKKAKVA
jgi:histone acetyltransferase 1